MKFGIRTPSLKRMISTRLSPKRQLVNVLGLKMPRGYGILRNPKRAIYNKIYNRITINVPRLIKKVSK